MIIFIPTYNRADILKVTLATNVEILKAANSSLEIIVIDNASTDQTKEVCLSLGVKYMRNKANIGLSGSFRKMLTYAHRQRQPFLILSDEDVIDPRFILGIDLLQISQNCVIIGGYNNLLGRDDSSRRYKRNIKDFSELDILYHGLISGFIFNISCESKLKLALDLIEPRNLFPHFALMLEGVQWSCSGIPTCFTLIQSEKSYLSEEWASKQHHFSDQSISQYRAFILEKCAKELNTKKYLQNLQITKCLYDIKLSKTNIRSLILICYAFIFHNQRLVLKYLARYYGL